MLAARVPGRAGAAAGTGAGVEPESELAPRQRRGRAGASGAASGAGGWRPAAATAGAAGADGGAAGGGAGGAGPSGGGARIGGAGGSSYSSGCGGGGCVGGGGPAGGGATARTVGELGGDGVADGERSGARSTCGTDSYAGSAPPMPPRRRSVRDVRSRSPLTRAGSGALVEAADDRVQLPPPPRHCAPSTTRSPQSLLE